MRVEAKRSNATDRDKIGTLHKLAAEKSGVSSLNPVEVFFRLGPVRNGTPDVAHGLRLVGEGKTRTMNMRVVQEENNSVANMSSSSKAPCIGIS